MSDIDSIDKIKNKLRKLKALADRGIDGEADTAQRLLAEVAEKYGIILDELAGLYAEEKKRADSLAEELRALRESQAAKVVVAESETDAVTCKESLQVGDTAKMRDALKYLRDASREFHHLILNSKHNEICDKYKYAEVAKLSDAIANAGVVLAAPPRNCDVGTEQEQQDRFREFCRHYESEGECGIGRTKAACPAFQGGRNPDCSLWWAQMPYESEVK